MVGEYKYLGVWFTTKNVFSTHVKRMAAKARKAINTVWGIWKRARINRLSKRLYLLETLVRSGGMYGAELWGWDKWEAIEKVQSRYTKMAMGLNVNTPAYIWMMEAGRGSVEIETRARAGKYLVEIMKMEEGRWPKICLREELRGLKNNYASKWGRTVKKAFDEVGDGEGLELLANGKISEAKEKIEEGIRTKSDQEIQLRWAKIEGSRTVVFTRR